MTAPELKLMQALATDRDDRAARALYRAYGDELYGFALRRLRDRGGAEEVVQDVFTRAWRHAGEFDPARGSLRTWLYGIARNAVIDHERRRARRPDVASDATDEQASPDEPIERAVLRWHVELALSRLRPEHREIVAMAHLRGMSVREIAERLGLAEGTVKSRTYYAMQSLRLALEELGVTG
jgi:RNA polymerase sigma-70 factor (ECF subfamily)